MIKQIIKKQNEDHVKLLIDAGIDEITARLLCNRGCETPEEATAFMVSDKSGLHSPALLPDINQAVETILSAVKSNKKITVYGDYDVDGITSISILYGYLRSLGADVNYYIPHRIEEGYGINIAAIDKIAADGTSLIITVDTGISAAEEIAYANSIGIQCVVTDHHECKKDDEGNDDLPKCPVVNPKREDSIYPFADLAGVGVTFKVIEALSDRETALSYVGLTAIGTIADIMPLKGENRVIVSLGLEALNRNLPTGIKALCVAAGSNEKPLDAGTVAFRIAPRLNAAGRIGDPYVAVELLLSDQEEEAAEKSAILCEENALRQKMETDILKDVENRLSAKKTNKIIIEKSPDWHNGVIGIVASKLSEIYSRPCILFCTDGTTAKGSGRSRQGINIFELLTASATGLSKFGGHAMAAGLTVKEEDFEAFERSVTEFAKATVSDELLCATEEAECLLTCADMTLNTYDTLKKLEPFGAANPTPAFGLRNLRISDITPISQGRFSRISFVDKLGNSFSALNFSASPDEMSCTVGDEVNIICTVDENVYRGNRTLSSIIKAMELSDISYGSTAHREYESERVLHTNFINDISPLPEAEKITRDDVGILFKHIKQNLANKASVSGRISPLGICRTLTRKTGTHFGYTKLRLCLDTMAELNLISYSFIRAKAVSEDEILTVTLNPQRKTSLYDSPTFVRAEKK